MIEPRPPLVLHVIHHLVIGGMENGLVNLINHMPADRYRHAIACVEDYSSFRDRLKRPDVPVIALHRSRIGIWSLRRQLFRLCRELQPAIVHSRNLSGLDALLPARLAGVPRRVHGEHGWDMSDLNGTQLRPALLRRLHAPLIDRYVAVSRHLEQFLEQQIGVRAGRIRQIYNGVDTQRFSPRGAAPAIELPEGFRGDGVVVLGTVGRLQAVKDQACLVRAFARLGSAAPDLAGRMRLVLVGDGPLQAELRALVASLSIGERVHFTGALDDVPAALRALDVFVLPSLNEGISNTILEAMATGLPVLATAVGGNTELVDDGVTGRLFPARAEATLADLLAAYVRDPALRATHGRAAREAAQERFSLDSMVHQYVDLYDKLH
jgi:sugar transferase (PEP-CTERM/EpsH1 system associated)